MSSSCPVNGGGTLEKVGDKAHYGKDPRQKSDRLSSQAGRKTLNVRPDLTALLWDNGEAQLLVVELEPDIFTQRGERRGQSLKTDASARLWGSVDRLGLLLNVLIFLIEALNLIVLEARVPEEVECSWNF